MKAGEHEAGCGEVTLDEAKVELERLLADSRFHATERAKKILAYVADQCFAGEVESVKAYAIALDVLDRPTRFDANSDPIVRIEVSRLRGALNNYYEAFGGELDITIHLPIGRYLTVFTRCKPNARPTEEETQGAETDVKPNRRESSGQPVIPRPVRRMTRYYAAGGAALLLVAAGTAGTAWLNSRPTMTERPSVTLTMISADEEHAREADTAGQYLVAALLRFRTLNISSPNTTATGSFSPRRQVKAAIANSYQIQMKYYADGDDRTVWWQIVDANGGGIVKSGIETAEVDGRGETMVRDELVSILAKRFASTRGVINNLEAHYGADVLGNGCVLKAEFELDQGGHAGIQSVLPCLEQTVALLPADTDALAALSRVLIAAEGADPATTPFDRALTLANQAVSLDPASDRAQISLMMAQFYGGRTDAAIASGNQALALNPNNPDVLSKLAMVLFSSGYQDAAVSLAEDAGKNIDAVPRDARLVLALDAYSRGDWTHASLMSEQINCSDLVVRAVRAASLGEMASPDAARSLGYLKAILPDYETSLKTWMERRRYPDPVIASLQQGLVKAGRVRDELAQAARPAN